MNLTNGATSKTVLDRFMRLDIGASKKVHSTFLTILPCFDQIFIQFQTQCMYIWIDGSGEGIRAKTKTVDFAPKLPSGMSYFQSKNSNNNVSFSPKIAKSFLLLHAQVVKHTGQNFFFLNSCEKCKHLISQSFVFRMKIRILRQVVQKIDFCPVCKTGT